MSPADIIRGGLALNSMYEQAPLPAGWSLRDRLFIPQDKLPVALDVSDDVAGVKARLWRGSITGWDWDADFRFFFINSLFGVGRMETGFSQYYGGATTESGKPLEPVDRLYAHSLGGPAATYDGCVSGVAGGAEIVLFATPEPGDTVFCQWAAQKFKAIYRLENPDDAVPDAPGRFQGYNDIGAVIPVNMKPLGPPAFDVLDPIGSVKAILEFNHHLPNYIAAYQLQESAA